MTTPLLSLPPHVQCLSRLRSRSAPQLCFTLFKDEFIEISTKLSAVVACRCSPTQRGRRHDGSGDLVATRLPRFSLFPLTRSPSSTALLGIVATKDVYISTLSDTWNPSFPPLSRLSAPTRFPFFFFSLFVSAYCTLSDSGATKRETEPTSRRAYGISHSVKC